jgi:hypothetical protein
MSWCSSPRNQSELNQGNWLGQLDDLTDETMMQAGVQ